MGRATYVSKRMHGWAISEHLLRIRMKDKSYPPEYVFAFLASWDYGYPLLTALRHGKDVPEIDSADLENLHIPQAPAETVARIVGMVQDAFSAVDRANQGLIEARSRLLSRLGWSEQRIPAQLSLET